jgi:hypothetical protein
MTAMPEGYYSRHNPTKGYERHLFVAGRVLQSAELNEVQENERDRTRRVADVLFKDGSVIRDAGVAIDAEDGIANLQAGIVYVRGDMRGLAPASFPIPLTGTVFLGVYLKEEVISSLEDPELVDPAIGSRNAGEPGARRLKVTAVWGMAGDGTPGEFYPVYTVVDGEPIGQTPPPNIEAVALAIASYDRQSAGGFYVSTGLTLTKLADEGANQVYSLGEGVARVDGREVVLQHARRVVYAATPDLKQVIGEPVAAVGGTQTITPRHGPISSIDQVLIRTRKTLTGFARGPASGGSDVLPDSPILSIVGVNQGGTWNGSSFTGGTTYTQGTDYKLTGDAVDWSLAGNEPNPSTTYTVVYEYTASVTPTSVTETTFQVSGAVSGSTTTYSYRWKRPRYDRLCLDPMGNVVWVQGTPNDVYPLKPMAPPGVLPVASVLQTWKSSRSTENDGVQLVPMNQLQQMQGQIDDLFAVVSEGLLQTKIALSDPATKRGIHVDPLLDDGRRDPGVPEQQTAAIYDGVMTLAMTGVVVSTATLDAVKTLPLNNAGSYPVIEQTLKTGSMLVNPYMAFTPIPASVTLEPATDFWTEIQTTWASPVTRRFERMNTVVTGPTWGLITREVGRSTQIVVENTTEAVGSRVVDAPFLRPIQVAFTLSGFGIGETLSSVKFDGVAVSFTA